MNSVQAHTSNLANSIFLPPGAAVVELIQRFWSWKKLDQSFKDQTDRMGDIHHFAWRAFHANQTVYLRERDLEKCGTLSPPSCSRVVHACDRRSKRNLACFVVYGVVCHETCTDPGLARFQDT